jgi:integrase/recombinase XerD
MLTIYRRHRTDCPRRGERENRTLVDTVFIRVPEGKGKCSCPFWVDGYFDSQKIRKALKTRNQQEALDEVRNWRSLDSAPKEPAEPFTIQQAGEKFLADAKARQLNESTIYKYRLLFKQIGDFAQKRGLRYLKELDLPMLDDFRSEWKDGPRSSLKKLERLRAFFGFALRRKWVGENPASDIKAPRVPLRPTLPFTREEVIKTLAALEAYGESAGLKNAQRLRAFVLVLRYSGLRIGDAVQLSTDRVQGNRLFLYTQKTGVPVYCVLPDFVVKTLESSPRSSARYFFWTGQSKTHSAIGKWQRRLQRLFEFAEVSKGHAHRFRDTFAVELLLSGVPLERVSVLLGHSSIRVTERHYAPWVRSRQEQLEADLQRAWSQDPIALMGIVEPEKGTKKVHAKQERPN